MIEYNETETRPKCGGKDIADTYYGNGKYKDREMVETSHIERHCRRCQYEWSVLLLDYKEEVLNAKRE